MLDMVETVRGDIAALESLDLTSFDPTILEQVGPLLDQTQHNLETLAVAHIPPGMGTGLRG